MENLSEIKRQLEEHSEELTHILAVKANRSAVTTLESKVVSLETNVGNGQSGLVQKVNTLETTVGDSQSGLVQDVDALETTVGDSQSGLVQRVNTLEATVGDSQSGLVQDVEALTTTVGDSQSGLVHDVDALTTTVGDSQSGLVQDVDALTTTVGDSQSGLVQRVTTLENNSGGGPFARIQLWTGTQYDQVHVLADVKTMKMSLVSGMYGGGFDDSSLSISNAGTSAGQKDRFTVPRTGSYRVFCKATATVNAAITNFENLPTLLLSSSDDLTIDRQVLLRLFKNPTDPASTEDPVTVTPGDVNEISTELYLHLTAGTYYHFGYVYVSGTPFTSNGTVAVAGRTSVPFDGSGVNIIFIGPDNTFPTTMAAYLDLQYLGSNPV